MSSVQPQLSWDDFIHALRHRLAVNVERITPESPLADHVSTGVAHGELLGVFFDLAGGLEAGVFRSLTTFGESLEWINVARDSGSGAAVRPASDRVWLRGLRSDDIPLLFDAAMSPRSYHRWRFRGERPTPHQFSDTLYQGVLAQFMVEDRTTSLPQGLVCAYSYQPENQLCSIAFQRVAASVDGAEMTLGMFYLLEFLFSRFPLRKVYADIMEWNLDVVDDSLGPMVEEGRLLEYTFHDGKWWDRIYLSISRDPWEQFAGQWRPLLGEGLAPTFPASEFRSTVQIPASPSFPDTTGAA